MENAGRNQDHTGDDTSDIPSSDLFPINPSEDASLEIATSSQIHTESKNPPEINETRLGLSKSKEQTLLTIKRGSGSPTDFTRKFKRKPLISPTQKSAPETNKIRTNILPEVKVEQEFLSGFSSIELEASRILGLIGQARELRVTNEVGSIGPNSLTAEVPPSSLPNFDHIILPSSNISSLTTQPLNETLGSTSKTATPFGVNSSHQSSTFSTSSHNKSVTFEEEINSEPSSPESSLHEDLRSEEENKSGVIYRCDFPSCEKTFRRLYNLKSHTRTHTDDRPFKCGQCEQAFSRNHDLKRHQKIHSGLKPFECNGCGKKFSRMDALGRHRTKKPQCQEKPT
ncbi:hypothetical protein K7432_004334 [Basidiobolus ranarum]|uniref:C2H2-type domain-containing protein n=1 Tax=Basidiobolus ranarum TaxID=34480 RepID=A0ABR2W4T9_9FUNG